jgi:hypothetical protein
MDSLEALRHRCKGCGKVSKKIGSQQDYCYDCKAAGKGHYSVAAFENAPDWVGTDIEITELCSGCSRGIPGYFRNRQQHKLVVILIEHPESNDSVHVRVYCRHCAMHPISAD